MRRKLKIRILWMLLLCYLTAAPFYLGICGQKVALYDTKTKRYYVTDTPVRSLPEADQKALQSGIPLDSVQAAAAALEDLCS